MTLEYLAGVGPCQANTVEPYAVSRAAMHGGVTITTVGGKNYFHWGRAVIREELTGVSSSDIALGATYQWACVEGFRIQGDFDSVGDEVEFCLLGGLTVFTTSRFRFFMVCKTDTSHYVIRVKDGATTLATGSTELVVGTAFHSLRFAAGGGRNILVVDTTEEFDVGSSRKFTHEQIGIIGSFTMKAGQEIEIRNIQLHQSSLSADRPDHNDMSSGIMTLSGEKAGADVGEAGDCESGAVIAHIDDWESGDADDVSTFNCILGGNSGWYVADLSNPTVTNLAGIEVWSRDEASAGGKTVNWDIIIRDGSSNQRAVEQTSLEDSWGQAGGAGFGNGPDITGWTSAKLNDTGIGFASPGSNGANDQHTAMLAEWFGIGNDAPPDIGRSRVMVMG
jgi:hypothetical protein